MALNICAICPRVSKKVKCNYVLLADKKVFTSIILKNVKVDRNPGSKWYVPHYVYPKKKYENFAAGINFLE